MRKMLSIFVALLVLGSFAWGDWEFDKVLHHFDEDMFGNPTVVTNSYGMHGVAVDGAGNVWFAMYNLATDSLAWAGGGDSSIYVYQVFAVQPDGTPLSFSPISVLTIGTETDTLTSSCRGMTTDNDGHILHSVAGKLYKINHLTGEGMAMYDFPDVTGSLTKAAVDDAGNVYIGTVGQGNPVKILNSSLVEQGNAIAEFSGAYTRAVAVSGDGKDLYFGSTWNGIGVRHFRSEIPGTFPHEEQTALGNFEPAGVFDTTVTITFDTTIAGTDTTITSDTTTTVEQHVDNFWPEDVSMTPDGKYLWAANTQSEWSSERYGSLWWIFDLATGDTVSSLGIQKGDSLAGGIFNGRGAAWSHDGNTVYLADFGYNMVTVWNQNPYVGIDRPITIPEAFKLNQNYPNPFNPSTSITYDLHQAGMVTLTVFDLKGREVSTLVNEHLTAGSHVATFDGSSLSSGLYIYQLSFNGEVSAKNMMLIK